MDDISLGDVCESYVSKGNEETVLLYESPDDVPIMRHDPDVSHLFEKYSSDAWINVSICSMVFNLMQISFAIVIVASFYHRDG